MWLAYVFGNAELCHLTGRHGVDHKLPDFQFELFPDNDDHGAAHGSGVVDEDLVINVDQSQQGFEVEFNLGRVKRSVKGQQN